jgi:NADH-quinone oxidoreductase subunit H
MQIIIQILLIIVPVLIGLAYVTLAERKIMASMQLRKGPNVVGVMGLLQPLADGLKLFSKETILPTHSNSIIFIIAPILSLILGLIS